MIDPRTVILLGDEIDQLRAEINEHARLLGISAEKELALRAENERLKAELAAALAACEAKDSALGAALSDDQPYISECKKALAIKPDAFALKAHDEARIEKCADVIQDAAKAAADNNDLRGYELLRALANVICELKGK